MENLEPRCFTAGDSVVFEKCLPGFPPEDGWQLTWALINSCGVHHFEGTSGTDGFHKIDLTAVDTEKVLPGVYAWQTYVELGDRRHTICKGSVTVEMGHSLIDGRTDVRSSARRVLDAIECVIENRASTDQRSITLNNRTLERTPIPDLLRLRDRYAALVVQEERRERVKNGLSAGNKVFFRFSNP